ncbi:chemotaxis protein CheW [Pseudomonas typographi]|uniref:Purine-binding chemotaxis protein CheW n=1 Tax=Pseudomonas typographi TaxID=2715964 RepID=A0ABR7Z7P2_9PSED|nr:chemotaxis protein CheW [Pseudomonas typographi]MBD1553683.1 purine-binding chemotaxis protein CheW [Pseudomonas typographi]MBD1589043.1 purine-binding chemotaxis protein CheW [Pseudomonas typographi]MBD1601442.1 purine-binding chemotaxis protein CheW [Pseudomonas typographi]
MNTAKGVKADTLFLIFYIGQERFALAAREVAEVLPRIALKPVAHAPAWVAGVFAHRGQMVPVLDVSCLTFGEPARARTSTRLVLVHYPGQRLLGLLLEQASDTLRLPAEQFRALGLDNRRAPYLGPVYPAEDGLIQWVKVDALLEEPVRQLLYAGPAQGAEHG